MINSYIEDITYGPLTADVTVVDPETRARRKYTVLPHIIEVIGARIGYVITDENEEKLERAARVYDAYRAGLRLLSYSDKSKKQLAAKLRERGFPRDIAEEAAEKLYVVGLITEGEQIERRAHALAYQRLRGRRRIAAELCALGYEREDIDEWFDEKCDIDFAAVCASAIERRGGFPPRTEPDERRRMMSYLFRQGFSGEDIRHALLKLNGME